MSSLTPEMTGISGSMYSQADFPDANEIMPTDFSLHLDSSYTTAVNNILFKNLTEVKDKSLNVYGIQSNWRKRYREFLLSKNNKLLEFLTCKIKVHPVLGPAEFFFQKFGKDKLNQNTQTIREIVLDISGGNSVNDINALCISKEMQPTDIYIKQTQFFLDMYKETSEKILEKENLLKLKLENLDSIQNKLKNFSNLSHNEFYESMLESIEKYIGKLFEENAIEPLYNEIIELYRTFFSLRDIILINNSTDSSEKEPICTICFKDPVSHTFSPCGHTFCTNCVKHQIHACGICRSNIRERIKIYFN